VGQRQCRLVPMAVAEPVHVHRDEKHGHVQRLPQCRMFWGCVRRWAGVSVFPCAPTCSHMLPRATTNCRVKSPSDECGTRVTRP
jgi:hypothetical protein